MIDERIRTVVPQMIQEQQEDIRVNIQTYMNGRQINNNKDFMKFKRSIMKGQLSMDSINSMMSNLDPSADAEMTPDEINALKDEILMSTGAATSKIGTPDTNTATGASKSASDDIFSELDI